MACVKHQCSRLYSTVNKKVINKPYEYTVLMPRTDFPMKANAAQNEPLIRKNIVDQVSKHAFRKPSNDSQPLFILHDGPPYANGDLHIGHAMNKILKDIIIRYKVLRGHPVSFIPGWDCHGLPIELKALQNNKASTAGRTLEPQTIRKIASQLATETVQSQSKQFQSWGILAEWGAPYLTMDKEYEFRQLEVFREMVRKGLIHRKFRPVYWSPSSKTALAEAELEYNDKHISKSVYFRVKLNDSPNLALRNLLQTSNLYLNIWTTTPWTIPANKAVCINETMDYVVVKDEQGSCHVSAEKLLPQCSDKMKSFRNSSVLLNIKGKDLIGSKYSHPLYSGQNQSVYSADFVDDSSGTGLVHIAPCHGFDDYQIGQKHDLDSRCFVDEDGKYTSLAGPDYEGKSIYKDGKDLVLNNLKNTGLLLAEDDYQHKYPYDWRTKKPVIIRTTKQWFADLETLKQPALQAIQNVQFIPSSGKTKLETYIKNRNEWCISRQRSWGVPIPAFYGENDEPLLNDEIIDHVMNLVRNEGSDVWWSKPVDCLLPEKYKHLSSKLKKGFDTMDVWFDSGTSWNNLRGRIGQESADIYLEGSDQYRGWFQSSLLTSVALTGEAPFKTLITHGFVMDQEGRKMSKSLGNVISPEYITSVGLTTKKGKKYPNLALGSDVLRFWVANTDYTNDVAVGDEILKNTAASLRKIRNTIRFFLGNLNDFDHSKSVSKEDLLPVDKYIQGALKKLSKKMHDHYASFEFSKAMTALLSFTVSDLSQFYLEIIKDRLYNGKEGSLQRLSAQSTLAELLEFYLLSLSPVTPHMCQEAYSYAGKALKQENKNLFELEWKAPQLLTPEEEILDREMKMLRSVKDTVNVEMERVRQEKIIGKPQEASLSITVPQSEYQTLMKHSSFLEELFSCSVVNVQESSTGETSIKVTRTPLNRCVRCWKHNLHEENTICSECHDIVKSFQGNKKDETIKIAA